MDGNSHLTETLGGAGGVGGLLADQIHTGTHTGVYYPLYDGNGNIAHYLSSTGALAAHFEYDPFGKLAVAPYESATGLAAELRFRFSTKYDEPVTGLYYYGYRYYDPVTGRWPSRDPIGEQGGFNLYAFVGNDAMNWLDILGLHEVGSPFKNLNDAIIAGGEYAVILSENDLDQRIKE